MHRRLSLLVLTVLTGLLSVEARSLKAQLPVSSTTRMATRAELEGLQRSYDQLAASTAYSESTRARARAQAEEVRRRLREGDFRPGDRILLQMSGGVTVNDTLTVLDGQRVQVPGVRQVELVGTLRSELTLKVTAEVREIVKEATVTVRPLTRIAVFGAVQRPGYLSVPVETTLDQLISLAGGPTDAARLDRTRLLRGRSEILDGGEVLDAIAAGRTLDGLGTREGDILEVARRDQGWNTQNTVQLITVLISPIVTFLLLR